MGKPDIHITKQHDEAHLSNDDLRDIVKSYVEERTGRKVHDVSIGHGRGGAYANVTFTIEE